MFRVVNGDQSSCDPREPDFILSTKFDRLKWKSDYRESPIPCDQTTDLCPCPLTSLVPLAQGSLLFLQILDPFHFPRLFLTILLKVILRLLPHA